MILSACGGRVPATVASTPTAVVQVQEAEPTAEPTEEPTAEPTQTPETPEGLIAELYSLFEGTFEAESFRAEHSKTPEEEAALLEEIPPADRPEFAHDYIILRTALDNLSGLHNSVDDPVMCAATPPNGPMYIVIEDPVVYNLTDNHEAVWHLWFPPWGPLPAELNREEYIVLYCGDKPAAHAEIEHHRELIEQRRVDEEDRAEAAFSEILRGLFHDSLGVDFPVQMEFSDVPFFMQIMVYGTDGQFVGSVYSDFDVFLGKDAQFTEFGRAHPEYTFSYRGVPGASLSSDPAVPVAVSTDDPIYTIKTALNSSVRQLIGAYPLGNGTGNDGQTIAETFSIIAERELTQRLFETTYSYRPYRQEYLRILLLDELDENGRHLPRYWDGEGDPVGIYGANELANAVIDLRNCGIEWGQTFREFFEMMQPIDTAEEVYSALEACQDRS